jgi:uncharacterized membrane protein
MLFTEVVEMLARSNMTTQWLCCALVALTISARQATAQPLACRYEVAAVLEAPTCGLGGVSTIGTAINPSGTTVVGYRFCLGTAMPWKWTQAGGLVMLTLPPWLVEATPADVNDNNIMVGTGVGTQAGQRGWVCDLNTMTWTELMPQNPPLGWSGANAISGDNTVVGFRSIGSKGDPVNPRTAFAWSAEEGFTDLVGIPSTNGTATDIAEDRTIVGSTGGSPQTTGARAVIWRTGIATILPAAPGCVNSYAMAIADGGIVVRGRSTAGPTTFAFLFDEAGYRDLGTLPGTDIVLAQDVDAYGTVVGWLVLPNSNAFVWQAGLMRNLADLLPNGAPFVEQANAITRDGMVVASGGGTVVLQPVRHAGDAVPDCRVDVNDLIAVIKDWGRGNVPADVNGDDVVDVDDLIVVVLNWST